MCNILISNVIAHDILWCKVQLKTYMLPFIWRSCKTVHFSSISVRFYCKKCKNFSCCLIGQPSMHTQFMHFFTENVRKTHGKVQKMHSLAGSWKLKQFISFWGSFLSDIFINLQLSSLQISFHIKSCLCNFSLSFNNLKHSLNSCNSWF